MWIPALVCGGVALTLTLTACGSGSAAPSGAPALPDELLGVAGELDCAGAPLVQVRRHSYDFTGDGVADALLAVRCDAGAGSPPSTVLAIAAHSSGPLVVAELLSADVGEVVSGLDNVGVNAVITAFGYSADAPRCCPDLQVTHSFRWLGETFDAGMRVQMPLPSAN
ncbi:MAG: hypothetical protein ACT4PP_06135 [Sporichthyaceae bacterium]